MNEQIISTELPVVKPCIKCGAQERCKRGKCKPCARERKKNWYAANADGCRKRSQKYRELNPDYYYKYYQANLKKERERNRKYREENPEKGADRVRKWAEANPKRVYDIQRKHYEANRDKLLERSRKWKSANTDKVNVDTHNRRARIKGSGGKLSTDIIQTLLTKQNNKCVCCGADLMQTGYHLDHIMPLALGGMNDDINVQLLTPKCNLSKGAKHPDDWAKEKGIACL